MKSKWTPAVCREYYAANARRIDGDLMVVPNAVIAEAVGVGLGKVSAVRKMIGCAGRHATFAGPVRKFLKRYPDFTADDAAAIGRFMQRHPEFTHPEFKLVKGEHGQTAVVQLAKAA